MPTYTASQLGLTGKFDNLGWYKSRQYDAATQTFSEPGQIHPNSPQQGAGKAVSNEVIAQSNPGNVSFIQSQIEASKIQAPVQVPYTPTSSSLFSSEGLTSEVDKYRKTLETTLGTRKAEVDTKLNDLRAKEQQTLDKIGAVSTPFREELEKTERERLYINKNFEENQSLVDELDQLLTEGNDLIKQQSEVTGLAAVRNPRIQKTMDDVNARRGVIEAVITARNGQIAQAQNLIDRSISAITADRSDQISYYETILSLNNRDIMSLDADSKKLAEEQLELKKNDLAQAQATALFVKEKLLDPATAALMGEAGVKLNDSVETINSKLQAAQYSRDIRDQSNEITTKGGVPVIDPSGVPSKQLVSFKDAFGKTHYYKMPPSDSESGVGVDKWIANQLFGGDANLSDITTPITTTDYQDLLSDIDFAVSPQVSPSAGIGSVYYDTLNRKWVYESSGWKLVG